MVGLELLPNRTAYGSWTGIRVYWSGRNHHFARHFLRRVVEAPVDFDVLRLLSHRTTIWRKPGCRFHVAIHCATREVALEPPRPPCTERELDHRYQHSPADRRTIFKIIRSCGSHG